jgi:hypothetical protein
LQRVTQRLQIEPADSRAWIVTDDRHGHRPEPAANEIVVRLEIGFDVSRYERDASA